MTTVASKLKSYRKQLDEATSAFHTRPFMDEKRRDKLIQKIINLKEKIKFYE